MFLRGNYESIIDKIDQSRFLLLIDQTTDLDFLNATLEAPRAWWLDSLIPFIVRADEELTSFLELEAAIRFRCRSASPDLAIRLCSSSKRVSACLLSPTRLAIRSIHWPFSVRA